MYHIFIIYWLSHELQNRNRNLLDTRKSLLKILLININIITRYQYSYQILYNEIVWILTFVFRILYFCRVIIVIPDNIIKQFHNWTQIIMLIPRAWCRTSKYSVSTHVSYLSFLARNTTTPTTMKNLYLR